MEKDNITQTTKDEMFLDDMEHLADMPKEQLDEWMADDENAVNSELLAGYREAACRERGRKPKRRNAWERLSRRAFGETPRHTAPRTKSIKTAAWAAAAVIAVLLAITPLLGDIGKGRLRPLACHQRTAEKTPVVASIAKNTAEDVIIWSDGKAAKAKDMAALTPDQAITETEADFSKASVSDINTSKTVFIPRGKLYKVTLSDGTEVWLNADSRLSFPVHFGGDKRQVELKGEAYFKVAKDASRPFVVKSAGVSTTVLGTEFNFRAYTGETPEVALIRGAVVVDDVATGKRVRLNPGQAATVGKDRISVGRINTDYYTQWKEGLFYFDDNSLLDVMKELGRWYNVSIEIEDQTLARYNIHFIAERDESLDQIVSDLNFFSYLNVSKKADRLIISRKKAKK